MRMYGVFKKLGEDEKCSPGGDLEAAFEWRTQADEYAERDMLGLYVEEICIKSYERVTRRLVTTE